MLQRIFVLGFCFALLGPLSLVAQTTPTSPISVTTHVSNTSITNQKQQATTWYRGNLHTHSLWSDGNDFPEMIVDWYRQNDYHFLALTDHNVLSQGERWMSREKIDQRSNGRAFPKYVERFGESEVETRDQNGSAEVRLKGLEEFRSRFEKADEFLLMQGEEVSDSVKGRPVHMNATNLLELLQPMGGATVREAIAANLRAAKAQEAASGRPILVHVNHPNFGYAITAEDLAFVVEEQFFEVYNGHPGVGHEGKVSFPAVERIWDIANTLRIAELKSPPMLGLGTDDSHNYHDDTGSISGRGWVMVRAPELKPEAIITAMRQGDFYASSGVYLKDVIYDRQKQTLSVDVAAEEGVDYEISFIGTLAATDRTSQPPVDENGQPIVATRVYSEQIGATLKTVKGNSAVYQLTGDELFVRALITSNRPHPKSSYPDQLEQAWTQPVGWEKWIESTEK